MSVQKDSMKSPNSIFTLAFALESRLSSHSCASFLVGKPRFFLWVTLLYQSVTRHCTIHFPVVESFCTDMKFSFH